jgi:hypothetical protein
MREKNDHLIRCYCKHCSGWKKTEVCVREKEKNMYGIRRQTPVRDATIIGIIPIQESLHIHFTNLL